MDMSLYQSCAIYFVFLCVKSLLIRACCENESESKISE